MREMRRIMALRDVIEAYVPSNAQEAEDRERMLEAMDCFSNLLTRENAFMHFTASSWIVNRERTKALMVWHNIYKSWAWTGGHADGDEALLRVALREAMEETGLKRVEACRQTPISLEILPVSAHVKRGRFISPHLHLNLTYGLMADESEPLVIKPDENSGVRWFSLDEALNASREEEMRPIYEKLNRWARGLCDQ